MPNKTIWRLKPQTIGKHKVLREYLNQWFPVLGMTNRKILFIDGFAGPGEYLDGESGSPIIAIESFLEHKSRNLITAEVGFVFIEKNRARYEHLSSLVEQRLSSVSEKPWVSIIHGSYDQTVEKLLNKNQSWEFAQVPTFVMIDPFGVSDTPLEVVKQIIANPRSEIYFSFMFDPINRFKGKPEFEPHLDSMFGTHGWRQYIDIKDSDLRKKYLYLLYKAQLKNIGAEQVLRFELYKLNKHEYTIFFASKHPKGSDCMKKAIWKIAPWGDYAFRSAEHTQVSLGLETPDFEPLKEQLINKFAGKGWVTIEDIESFVKSDKTPYHSGQLRQYALKPLEDEGKIQVDPRTRKQRRTYPQGTRLIFSV